MKQIRKVEQPWLLLLLGMLLFVGVGEQVQAQSLNVANNGLDSFTCGDEDNPCRSISQAIANASAGDTIIVGPGRYGDLNGNGTFGEEGEEDAQVGFGCFCMINLNKQVTLVSRDGAFTTVLDAGGALVNPVSISASGVVFGQPKRGFLITGAGGGFNGLGFLSASDVTVAGNVVTANGGSGIGLSGSNNLVHANLSSGNGSAGFAIFGDGNLVRENAAIANSGSGFSISGAEHKLHGNEASANGYCGFLIYGTGHELRRNSALGNEGFGIQVTVDGSATIIRNNIYGNNNVPTSGFTNCGLFNQSEGQITATHNFWGEDSGPGPDPADEVCDVGGSMTVFVPFTTQEFKIRVRPLK